MGMISNIYGNNLYSLKAIKAAKKRAKKKLGKYAAKKEYGLTQKQLFNYCKAVLGVGTRENTSMYVLTEEALEKNGIKNFNGLETKVFVYQYQLHIKEFISSNKPIANKFTSRNIKSTSTAVASDDFLNSFEWRKLRLVALKKYGRKCLCCGATPETGAVMNVDHIKPRKFYPELALDINNLQVLCHECNHGKGNWDETDWRAK